MQFWTKLKWFANGQLDNTERFLNLKLPNVTFQIKFYVGMDYWNEHFNYKMSGFGGKPQTVIVDYSKSMRRGTQKMTPYEIKTFPYMEID